MVFMTENKKTKLYKSTTVIKDAVTGKPTEHMVGSSDENLYFKVRDCGNKIKMDEHAPHLYFFSSRNEFLTYFNDEYEATLIK